MKISFSELIPQINIEDYLHKIDLTFKDKTQKDIYMTYFMVFALIFAFSYLLFWDTSEGDFNKKSAQISTISTKINVDNIFLQQNPQVKVNMLDEEIAAAKNGLILNKDNNNYIKSKIETISSLIYDERTWGEYLHSISNNAQKYGVQIVNFTTKNTLSSNQFGHMLDINIKSTGDFRNTLKFINSLETSELVVDIHSLDIRAEDTLNSDLNLSVWGIIY
ncbi:MAG: hypothetical protein DRG78_25005 [Epsilonproteobacteria bacterium]|nr:MAG: hypothetical protein DRG78_25005 [Campylobacterota bacterium]